MFPQLRGRSRPAHPSSEQLCQCHDAAHNLGIACRLQEHAAEETLELIVEPLVPSRPINNLDLWIPADKP